MLPQFIELDRVTIVAPLGLRFHDTISGSLVGAGLSVWAYPFGRPMARRRAVGNRGGVYVLHDASGLMNMEHGDGTGEYWDQLPPKKSFIIEVSDDARRFQPFQFTENLPIQGIYKWNGSMDASPPAPMSSIPLYSSPVRTAPAGMAVIRADLWDPTRDVRGGPAAWAVMEVFEADKLVARGIADEEGRIALIFPYPSPRSFAPSSPPGSPLSSPPVASGPPLTEQVWPLRLRALYTPMRPLSSPPDASESNQALPDLRFTLSQPEANIWADAARTEPFLEVAIQYGHELILKSRPSPTSPPDGSRKSVLFITPAVSPP